MVEEEESEYRVICSCASHDRKPGYRDAFSCPFENDISAFTAALKEEDDKLSTKESERL